MACTFQQLNFQKCTENGVLLPFLNFKCASCHNDVQCPPFRHLNFQKRSKSDNSLTVLTSKCASCHNGVHFFNSATSESAPRMVCLYLFDFQMRFLPQRCQLFRHLNFQNCSEPDSFSCPVLTSKCASRHNGVQLFISHVVRWLRTRRFSEPPF